MPVQTSYPGVYVDEQPSGVHTIVGVSTSVTAFVGAARYGATQRPTRLHSVADYVRRFGPAWDRDHPMGHTVAHFFANGGSEAIILRVPANGAVAATAPLPNATPDDVLILTAVGEGAWANRVGATGLEVSIDYTAANPGDLFNLVLSLRSVDARTGQPVLAAQETYRDVSMAPNHRRFVVTAMATSALVTAALAVPAIVSADAGTSTSAAVIPANVDLSNTNNRLRVAIDYGPPTDLVLFPAETNTAAAVSKAAADIAGEIDAQLTAAGLDADAALDGAGNLVITSGTADANSAVVVSPAPAADAGRSLGLGLTYGGTEVSGAASLRPSETGAVPVGFHNGVEGGTDGGTSNGIVTGAQVVPAGGDGGIF